MTALAGFTGVEGVSVGPALEAFSAGKPVVVLHDTGADEEFGLLVFAAESATAQNVAFAVRHGSGFVCVALLEEDADRLDLPSMPRSRLGGRSENQGVCVDARTGITTGISATDRAHTIRLLAAPAAGPADFARPGHVVPIRARPEGLLGRQGQAEVGVDLARLAGKRPCGALSALVSQTCPAGLADGTESRIFAKEHGLALVTTSALTTRRLRTATLLQRTARARLPVKDTMFTVVGYASTIDRREHLAFVLGEVAGNEITVRVHNECLLRDVFGDPGCECDSDLQSSMAAVSAAGRGVVVYVRNGDNGALCRPWKGELAEDGDRGWRRGYEESYTDSVASNVLEDLAARPL